MSVTDYEIGRIEAVIYAAEEVLKLAKAHKDRDTEIKAKETAYDQICKILDDYPLGRNDWQE